jgi:CO/xanthine dehydrogenase Mo-binding subunit
MSVFGIAPAVANAIAGATGARLKELPMSEKLFGELQQTKTGKAD